MRTLTRTLAIAGLTFGLMCAGPAAADEASRLSVAREVVQLSGAADNADKMVDTMRPLFVAAVQGNGASSADAEHLGDLFIQEFRASMPQALEAIAIAYSQEFTETQLVDMRTFFQSPAGIAMRQRLPHLMDELQQVGGRLG